jgi:hypothetical protein
VPLSEDLTDCILPLPDVARNTCRSNARSRRGRLVSPRPSALRQPSAGRNAYDVVLLAIVIVDAVKHRRLHPAFFWGSLFLVSVQALSTWISGTSVWLRIAQVIMKPFP